MTAPTEDAMGIVLQRNICIAFHKPLRQKPQGAHESLWLAEGLGHALIRYFPTAGDCLGFRLQWGFYRTANGTSFHEPL